MDMQGEVMELHSPVLCLEVAVAQCPPILDQT